MHDLQGKHRRGAGRALFMLAVVGLAAAVAVKWAWRELAVEVFAAPEISFAAIASGLTALVLICMLIGAAFTGRRGRRHVDPR